MRAATRRTIAALLTAAASAAAVLAVTGSGAIAGMLNLDPEGNPRPEGCAAPTRTMTLYAKELRGQDGSLTGLGWATRPGKSRLDPGNASIPGPTIEMIEGECLEVTVVNDVARATLEDLADRYGGYSTKRDKLGVSLHVHGVKYTNKSDGTLQTDSIVPPGQSRTYTWYAEPRVSLANGLLSPGTAGYWWFHDHVVGTKHGTGGISEGLYGALIVRRPQDPRPDKTFPLFMGPGMKINGTVHSHSDHGTDSDCLQGAHLEHASPHCLIAQKGERVEFAVVNVGNDFHTFHLHGHSWADNRTGLVTSQADETRVIDAKIFGPSESFGFQVIAGHQVGVGNWMLHCHVQNHSDAGMATWFQVI